MIFLIIFVTFAASAQANFVCPKRPNFTTYDAYSCCKIQLPKFENLPIECSRYMIKFNKPVGPCAYECIMNVTHILRNGRFEFANIPPLLRKIYTEEASLNAYIMGYEKCAIIFNKKISEQSEETKSSPGYSTLKKSSSWQQCSPIPLKFALCASREVFINCPPVLWMASSACEHIREYSKNCDNMLLVRRTSNRGYSSV